MDKSKLLEGLKKIKEAFVTLQKFVDAKLIDGHYKLINTDDTTTTPTFSKTASDSPIIRE